MSINFLITGATGTTGREVVNSLLNKNCNNIRVAVRNLLKVRKLGWNKNTEPILVDYNNDDSLRKALEGIHKLYLLLPGDYTKEQKIELGKKLIDFAKDAKVEHIVHLSSMGAQHDPASPHHIIEKYIENAYIPYTNLRVNWFMQNFTTFLLKGITHNHSINMYISNAKVSFVDARDIGEVAANALLSEDEYMYQSLTLTGPNAYSHEEVANILSFHTGLNIHYNAISDEDTKQYLAKYLNANREFINRFLTLCQKVKENQFSEVTEDIIHTLKKPPRSFKAFAQDYRDVFLK